MHKDANQTRREFIGTAAALVTGIGLTGPAAAHLSLAGSCRCHDTAAGNQCVS